ncbi:hypothetical protein KM043_006237 [Ampulex compressa]|nr:hypothetical protein KM043_006237 [Ampulex compressa]
MERARARTRSGRVAEAGKIIRQGRYGTFEVRASKRPTRTRQRLRDGINHEQEASHPNDKSRASSREWRGNVEKEGVVRCRRRCSYKFSFEPVFPPSSDVRRERGGDKLREQASRRIGYASRVNTQKATFPCKGNDLDEIATERSDSVKEGYAKFPGSPPTNRSNRPTLSLSPLFLPPLVGAQFLKASPGTPSRPFSRRVARHARRGARTPIDPPLLNAGRRGRTSRPRKSAVLHRKNRCA